MLASTLRPTAYAGRLRGTLGSVRMLPGNSTTISLLLACTFCCVGGAAAGEANFHNAKNSLKQRVALTGYRSVNVVCYCETYSVRRDDNATSLQLEVFGSYSIAGYHGSKESAGLRPLDPQQLRFSESKTIESITLTSSEWSFIHHAVLIEKLEIVAPPGILVGVRQLSIDDLPRRPGAADGRR